MIVVSNIASLNTFNQLKKNQKQVSQATERLASGLKINRAIDNAAGLAISEKMRALIRGAEQASRNTQDAISFMQTAEGGMEEITSLIHRTRELTVQAASDTVTHSDRQLIQEEIETLNKEINDIIVKTEFNTIKPLLNTDPGDYLYEDRSLTNIQGVTVASTKQSVNYEINNYGWESGNTVQVTNNRTGSISPIITTSRVSAGEKLTTVRDHSPQWSSDSEYIVFTSERDGEKYKINADGGSTSSIEYNNDLSLANNRTEIPGELRLAVIGSTLYLREKNEDTGSWNFRQSFSNYGGGTYSFSPDSTKDEASFVFTNDEGNLQRIDLQGTEVVGSEVIISNTDTTNIPPESNIITTNSAPSLYRMNDGDNASLVISKVTHEDPEDSRVLTYWDGSGDPPEEGGYYTVNGRNIEFFGDAVIGTEMNDSAQAYYDVSYVSSSTNDHSMFTTNLPLQADVYNMDGSSGPRSLNIKVGDRTVEVSDLLAERPSDPDSADGVFVNTDTGRIEFYGSWKPNHDQTVEVRYRRDGDGRNGVFTPTQNAPANLNTYNLDSEDLNEVRALRVFVGDREILLDEENGYTYNRSNGQIQLHGDARPDIPSNEIFRVEYVTESSPHLTNEITYGIPLGSDYPELYNLGEEDIERSIRIFNNGSEEIVYSDENGFQYDPSNNMLTLHGDARPDSTDSYTIHMIPTIDGVNSQDGVVEVALDRTPEMYGLGDDSTPTSIKVYVDGAEIDYDETEENGFVYDPTTNRIRIFGDARPDSYDLSTIPVIDVRYVYEDPRVSSQDETYSFQLDNDTLIYGINDDGIQDGPTSITVTKNGVEIPYNEENGFTINEANKTISLHGDYRPTAGELSGTYKVHSIFESSISTNVPSDATVFRVEYNGEQIPLAEEGHGYILEGGKVTLVGDYRPNVDSSFTTSSLVAFYHRSQSIPLDVSTSLSDIAEICEEKQVEQVFSEVVENPITVKLNGIELTEDQFYLSGNTLKLIDQEVSFTEGDNRVDVDYKIRHVTAYDDNRYSFQVGPTSGNNIQANVASFNTLLMKTNQVCILNHEVANMSLNIIDETLSFVNSERGNVGALINRMEHAGAINQQTKENLQAADSRIRDADIAREMMEMTRSNILSQASQSMLAQANQQPQSVLQLLG